MADKRWKRREREAAKIFGVERTPLSGGNSRHTRSDSLHPALYLEVKSAKRHKIWSLLDTTRDRAKKERKTPVVLVYRDGSKGALICTHQSDLLVMMEEYLKVRGYEISLIQERREG